MIQYNVLINDAGEEVIERVNEDGTLTYIPSDPANSDYQRYLNPELDEAEAK
jgi:hypothetical protein